VAWPRQAQVLDSFVLLKSAVVVKWQRHGPTDRVPNDHSFLRDRKPIKNSDLHRSDAKIVDAPKYSK